MKKKVVGLTIAALFCMGIILNLSIDFKKTNKLAELTDLVSIGRQASADGDCPGWDGSAYCAWDGINCVILAECLSSCPGGC